MPRSFALPAALRANSFFGLLRASGAKVYPENLADKGYESLRGDYGIDAVQLEFGADHRDDANRKATADVVAAAVEKFAELYPTDK